MEADVKGGTDLPKGWVWTNLGELIEPSKEKVDPRDLNKAFFIGLEHIESGTAKLLGRGSSDEVRSTKSVFRAGDLLYGKLRPYLNKVYVAEFDGICSTDILVFPQTPFLSTKYLLYRILSRDFVGYANRNMSGVQHPRVHFKTLARFLIPLPPLPEQHRIVAKVEELFTKLGAGVESLKIAKRQLKAYRQSVLSAAAEGRLTRKWREEHKSQIEPISILVERILEERKRCWDESRKTRKKSVPLKEPVSPDPSGLTKLPQEWMWVSLDTLLREPLRNGHSAKASDTGDGIRTLTLTAVTEGDFSERNTKVTVADAQDVSDLWLEPGDILIERSNTPALVGTTRVYRGPKDFAIFPDLVIRARTLDIVPLSFVEIILNSSTTRRYFRTHARSTSGSMPKINQTMIRRLPVPLPSIGEQNTIVGEVERTKSIMSELMRVIGANLVRSKHLRQSILRDAFSGKLLPQEPSDKPASVLLERTKRLKKGHGAKESEGRPSQAKIDAFQVS